MSNKTTEYWQEVEKLAGDIAHLSEETQRPIFDEHLDDADFADMSIEELTEFASSHYTEEVAQQWQEVEDRAEAITKKYDLPLREISHDIWMHLDGLLEAAMGTPH